MAFSQVQRSARFSAARSAVPTCSRWCQSVTAGSQRTYASFNDISRSDGAKGYPHVNARYQADPFPPVPRVVEDSSSRPKLDDRHWKEEWSKEELTESIDKHAMLTWGPSGAAKDRPMMVKSEGVWLEDIDGKRWLDWTSMAVCTNMGYTVPPAVIAATVKQLQEVPYVYGGLASCPVHARLSQLMSELCPKDITGFLFPCGGSEANEAAIRIARRYSGKHKILTQYRSYHGGSTSALVATGDFRRWYADDRVSGFVKMFNPAPFSFSFGDTDETVAARSLEQLEEQLVMEGPHTIAAVMLESIVGAGGALVPPVGWMEGVRALCTKYDIILILDEVMAGFGRTGKHFAFQHFEGVVPDILTSAKGLSASYLPLSMVGLRKELHDFFRKEPLGWGATYHGHPVSMALAYESLKHYVTTDVCGNASRMQDVMLEQIEQIVQRHPSVKQGRAIGLLGCLDLVGADGKRLGDLNTPPGPEVKALKKAMQDNGLIGLLRAPLLHCTPPLVINKEELEEGFRRLSKALTVLDKAIGKA